MTRHLEWQETYRIGFDRIDSDHQKLVGLTNDVFEAFEEGDIEAIRGHVFNGLMDYVEVHFAREEAAMAASNYPYLEAHIQRHQKMKEELLSFQKFFALISTQEVEELFRSFLQNWLFDHILKEDMGYRETMEAHRQVVEAALERG
ncbi:MAG: bacteriohemerythrin [Magnetospiraceae bacterium]